LRTPSAKPPPRRFFDKLDKSREKGQALVAEQAAVADRLAARKVQESRLFREELRLAVAFADRPTLAAREQLRSIRRELKAVGIQIRLLTIRLDSIAEEQKALDKEEARLDRELDRELN
jgi:hypothetical protein